MSHIEIVPNLWLGNQYSTTLFNGNTVLSIGCKSKKQFINQMKLSIIDSKDSDITKILPQAMDFIDKNIKSNNQILVLE
jgi:hypothetical protein